MPAKKLDTIIEVVLKHDVSRGIVTGARVIETEGGFQLVFTINANDYYLAARRHPNEPRLFKDFERLTSMLRSIYPEGSNNLLVEHQAPYISKALSGPKLLASKKKKKKASKKKTKIKAKARSKSRAKK